MLTSKRSARYLKEEAKAREEEARKAREDAARRHHEANQFAVRDGGVWRQTDAAEEPGTDTKAPKPRPVARSVAAEREEILQASMSDQHDPTIFLESEDGRLYRRQGVSPDIPRKLYRGEWTIEAHIDLHGLRVEEAAKRLLVLFKRANCVATVAYASSMARAMAAKVVKAFSRKWFVVGSNNVSKS